MARLNIITAKHKKAKRTQKHKQRVLTGGYGDVSWSEFFMGQRYTKKRNSGGSSHRRHQGSRKSRAGRR